MARFHVSPFSFIQRKIEVLGHIHRLNFTILPRPQ